MTIAGDSLLQVVEEEEDSPPESALLDPENNSTSRRIALFVGPSPFALLTKDTVNLVLGKKLGSDLLERLKISLLAAEAVLDDVEYKQLGNDRV